MHAPSPQVLPVVSDVFGVRILLVTSDFFLAERLQGLFDGQIQWVTNAAAAMDHAAGHDVIAGDVEMLRGLNEVSRQSGIPLVIMADEPCYPEASPSDCLVRPFSTTEFRARVGNLARLRRATLKLESVQSVVRVMAKLVEARDNETSEHCRRLSELSCDFARHYGCTEPQIEALFLGGSLHDIGKIGIPDSILLAPRKLTAQEMRIVEGHTVLGWEICRNLHSIRDVLPIIRHHHERFDGTGYPDRLHGKVIPLLARLFQVVDIYDALRTTRPYKRSMTHEEAMAVILLERARGWRDPDLVDAFQRIYPEGVGIYPEAPGEAPMVPGRLPEVPETE